VLQEARMLEDTAACWRLLDLAEGASQTELKQAWRDHVLVWHPDRVPERLRALATEKVKQLNEAYERLRRGDDQPEPRTDPAAVLLATCARCVGTGEVTCAVNAAGHFEHGPCPTCHGAGALVCVAHSRCSSCAGRGRTGSATARAEYLRARLGAGERGAGYRLRYRRLWVRYEQQVAVCKTCAGAGYTFFRPDGRRASLTRRHPRRRQPTTHAERRTRERRQREATPS
jgi:DnaJ-class molecular chaperone